MSVGRLAAFIAALALAVPANSADITGAPPPAMVTVSATASQSVANDRLQAWLRAEAEDPSPAAAANEVNTRIAKALARVKALPNLVVQTSGYTTQQIAERDRPMRWHVAQSITIEGSDFASIAALATQLQQDGLLLGGLVFTVSETKRRATEDALTQQALASWRTRAQNAARGLGFAAWRPGHVTVATNDFGRPQPLPRVGISAMAGSQAPVALEGGTTEVAVTVTGDAVLEAGVPAPR